MKLKERLEEEIRRETQANGPMRETIESTVIYIDNTQPQKFFSVYVKKLVMNKSLEHISLQKDAEIKHEPILLPSTIRATMFCESCQVSLNMGSMIEHLQGHADVIERTKLIKKKQKEPRTLLDYFKASK